MIIGALSAAHLQHPLRRALDVEDATSARMPVQGRHEAMHGVERDLVKANKHSVKLPLVKAGLQGE